MDNKNIKSQKIEKSFTFFIVPFHFESANIFTSQEGLWIKETKKVSNEGEDGEVLYSYIMDFLQGQLMDGSTTADHLDIYRLNINKDSDWYKDFWSNMVNYPNLAYIPQGKNNAKEDIFHPIKFRILSGDENGFKAPHLFIFGAAKIGILTFCIELAEKEKYMSDLKLFNYHLHKIHKPLCKCVCPQIGINPRRNFNNEQERIAEEKKLQNIRQYITPHNDKITYDPYGSFEWNTRGFVDLLLKGVEHSLFSNIRIHLFVYCQIDDSTDEQITREDLMPDVIRLSRCVTDKYLLPFDVIDNDGSTLNGFENIYYASSVEGTAIVAVAKKSNKGFIEQMDGNIRLRYIWIYLLVVIQRYTLLNMNRLLMEIDSTKEQSEDRLWEVMDTIKNVKLRCYYTDVSPYTQHSQFYQLCCNNLHVREAFDEIDEKTQAMNLTIDHDLENGQRRLNLVVGILTVFQVAQAIYVFADGGEYQKTLTWISFIVCFILLYFVMKWERKDNTIIKYARNLYYISKKK